MDGNTLQEHQQPPRFAWFGLATLFAAIYFIQGMSEPTEGLVAQSVRSLFTNWGRSAAEAGLFLGLLGIPWMFKLVYGLLTDFLPLWGTRRRSYLLLANAIATLAFVALYWWTPTPNTSLTLFFAILLIPTIGVAFTDVVVDALMIEVGQPRGLTGRLQSVQWAAMYAAQVVMGVLGGWLNQQKQQRLAFLIAAGCTGVAVLLTFFFVRERPIVAVKNSRTPIWRLIVGNLRDAARHLTWFTAAAAAFLFLWNFNPFADAILQRHMLRVMNFSEQFYGATVSVQAIGALSASIAYGFYCRRVRFSWLIHLAILAGVLTTACNWFIYDQTSAMLISFIVGFAYLTGTLVQLELAARVSPIAVAGTAFAILMSISNAGISSAQILGGFLYDRWSSTHGPIAAYNLLVGVGAATTALCWLLVPWLNAAERRSVAAQDS